jgi:transposase
MYAIFMRALKIQNPKAVTLALQDEIQRSEESRYDHRLHGMLLVARGLSAREAAAWLGDAARTVELWVHRFQKEGLAGLREGRRPGRPSRLNPNQLARAQAAVRSSPAEVGLSADLWDANTLSAYLHSLGANLKPRQCRNLLRQWGFREPH